VDQEKTDRRRLPRRRDVLQLGMAGVAALGVANVPLATRAAQTPGSGQGPQPPKPPAPEDVANPVAMRAEDWTEPWVWRPSEWPGEALALHVVGNVHPARATSTGNRFTPLYSFNGSSPGPTIRMRGDEKLRIKLRNMMGPNFGSVPKGPAPDPFELPPAVLDAAFCAMAKAEGRDCAAPPTGALIQGHFDEFFHHIPAPMVDTSCFNGMVNVPHGSHTTNLHTHGLHAEPGLNSNGTLGDNTFLRVLPRGDWETRRKATDPACRKLEAHERVGEADLEHTLGDVLRARRLRDRGARHPHPPGTHWYHPHCHGATHDQVASGLAGFLIVEGDVDDAINRAMTGVDRPDPTEKTGPFDYRERLMLIQRVEIPSTDMDSGPRRMQGRVPPPVSINGGFSPALMSLRPGAVERWRVLNASVDGRGFKNFMVLEGQFVFSDRQLWKVRPGETAAAPRTFEPATRQDVDDATRSLYQLSFDGITLVAVENGRARHTIKDLSRQNPGTRNPLNRQAAAGEDPTRALLKNVEDCYRDAASLRNLYVRPNQVLLGNANRADVFFKAPIDAAGKVYTVLAQEFILQTDNFQQRLQVGIASGRSGFSSANPAPVDVVVGYVRIAGDPVPGGDFDVMSLRDRLPEVPPYLQPVGDAELRVPAAEASARGVPAGSFRSRVVSYSGYGPTDFPLIEVPESFARQHPELKHLSWDEIDGTRVLLPPYSRTMAINGQFDLAATPEPPPAEKFGHHDAHHPRALVDTAEEWVLYNCSIPLWSHTNKDRFKQPGQYAGHYRAHPLSRIDGQARFAKDPEFQITTKGADHPFHIHINPCWVTRLEVPDEQGRLHNMLDEPRWMDTVDIPRGGRAVFRSRFADFVGKWVNHCHILMHEDHGMMQAVESVARAADANYRPRTRVASHAMPAADVNAIYPAPSLELMYRQSLSFVDSSPEVGQVFPGFALDVPKLD
jgi:FtsP/CotA-like multicopper oxidase with cupredoxin domain